MTERPSFDDMRVEVTGAEVRLVFMADTPEHAQRIARSVAAKIKHGRLELDEPVAANDVEEINGRH